MKVYYISRSYSEEALRKSPNKNKFWPVITKEDHDREIALKDLEIKMLREQRDEAAREALSIHIAPGSQFDHAFVDVDHLAFLDKEIEQAKQKAGV